MRNIIRALRGRPVELSEKQQAKLEAQRDRARRIIAEQEAKGAAAVAAAAPYLPPGTTVPEVPMHDGRPDLSALLRDSVERARDSVGELFDDRAGIIGRPAGLDMNRPPQEIEDEEERARVAAVERSARDVARRPYLAPVAPEVAYLRVPTTGHRGLDDVLAALQSAGLADTPERVYGVFRLPERYDERHLDEGQAYVEWWIAHRPGTRVPVPAPVGVTGFTRDAQWVARRPGEPSVLDEDVAAAFCLRAGLGPEECFGVPRMLHLDGRSSENGSSLVARLEGTVVLHRPTAATEAAVRAMAAQAPLALPAAPPPPIHVEVLDWEAVAAWVRPDRWGGDRVPSPLPHLPSDWSELLEMYLQVVGVAAEDCYGVQVARTSEGPLADLSLAGGGRRGRRPPEHWCADERPRRRHRAAEHVVLVYRDSPALAAGRERWAAYQREVLDARLDHLTGVRPPLVDTWRPPPSFLSDVADLFNPLDPWAPLPTVFGRSKRPLLGPYCGVWEG